jgi:hypothetical protein
MSDVAEIAKGLSETQRRGLFDFNYLSAHGRKAMERKGLITAHRLSYRKMHIVATPLGHAVRAHLQEASHD